jgi:hypothetical protein
MPSAGRNQPPLPTATSGGWRGRWCPSLRRQVEGGARPPWRAARLLPRRRQGRRVDFSRRTFEHDTDFNYARFCYPPVFEPNSNFARIDFTGAYIGIGRPGSFRLTCDTKVLLRLGALRKNAGEKRDDDLERDLYIEERKAELGIHLVQWFEDLKKAPMIAWRAAGLRNGCTTHTGARGQPPPHT